MIPLVADDAGLEAYASAVSTPGSPLYGHYEAVPTLAERFGATPAVRARALAYLRAAGASHAEVNATGMFAAATLTVARAQRAFGVRLGRFAAAAGAFVAPVASGRASAAAVGVPAGLRGVADGVIGLDTRPVAGSPSPRPAAPARAAPRAAAPARGATRARDTAGQQPSVLPLSGTGGGCGAERATGAFTPNQYLNAYGYSPLRAAGLSGRGERVALIEVDGVRVSDLRAFAGCFGLRVPRLSLFAVGSRHLLAPGGETTLDLELLDAAAPGLDAIQVYENAGNTADVLSSLAQPLLVPGAKPQVISISLGVCEPLLYDAFGAVGVLALERDVELSAATGITVLAAGGDEGSAGCIDAGGGVVDALAIDYPASSPWVTAIGGTNLLLTPGNTILRQPVWNDATLQVAAGGGGFSDLFRKPSYQNRATGGSRRVVPDVSMLADLAPGYAVYCTARDCTGKGPWRAVGGTSAAAPLLAGGAALVDQDLHRHAREFLGFMNPLLYSIGGSKSRASVFSDVTAIGNDVGPYLSGAPLGCCNAGPGFDAASGWGSINVAGLDAAAQRLLPQVGDISLAIPAGQQPLRRRALKARVHCSQRCAAYALAYVTFGSDSFSQRSGTRHFPRRGTHVMTIALSARERTQIRSALAHHLAVRAEVFAVELGPRGEAAKVTAGLLIRIRS